MNMLSGIDIAVLIIPLSVNIRLPVRPMTLWRL